MASPAPSPAPAAPGGPRAPGGGGGRRVTGGRPDRPAAKDLHLSIGKDGGSGGSGSRGGGAVGKGGGRPDVLEDSGIGLDDHLPPTEGATTTSPTLKVLATPPTGKRKNLSSPQSAPAGTGPPRSFSAAMTVDQSRQTHHSKTTQKVVHQSSSPAPLSLMSCSPPRPSSPGFAHMLKETVHRTFSGSSTSSMTSSSATSASATTTTTKHAHSASFQVGGSDSEEESTTSGGSGSSSRRSSQKATPSGKESKGKGRFRRMLNPLRRSHSAGCSQDVPAHALFLKQEAEKKKLSSSQKSVDKSSLGDVGRTGSESEGDDADRKSSKSKKKSLARDLKDKMAFLRRRHTDTALAGKLSDGKAPRPTAETVATWSRDFDNLLLDKVGLDMFRDFLQSEFSDENLEFWIACQEYKNLKENKLAAQAQKIYTDFVAVQAPREINLDSKTRMACHNAMSSPNRHTFEQAQKRIQALMEKDSYPRFLKSETYQELCSELKLNT